jgi:hypothetical protein
MPLLDCSRVIPEDLTGMPSGSIELKNLQNPGITRIFWRKASNRASYTEVAARKVAGV